MRTGHILLFAFAAIDAVNAASLSHRMLRLRGGEEDLVEQQLKRQGNVGPLCRDEIVEKLNAVPTFCIMQEDGSVISLPDPEGEEGDECCTWFVDAAEAKSTLRKVVAANPDLSGLKLVSHGLGDFVTMANGWPRKADSPAESGDGPRLKLKPSRDVTSMIGEQLVSALKGAGLDPGLWQLAVFLAEELAQATPEGEQTMLPIFLHPNDVRQAYDKVGIPPEALNRVKVLELRQLLKMMSEETPDAVNPWRAVRFLTSPAAIQLAQELA